jgi:hypothetical protein
MSTDAADRTRTWSVGWVAALVLLGAIAPTVAASQAGAHSLPRPAAPSKPIPDFNGDGYADLVVGAPQEDLESHKKIIVWVGEVHVLYGGAGGSQAISPDDQLWELPSLSPVGAVDYARFGAAFAWGDFNADRFSDLAISEPFADTRTKLTAGAVTVLYGSALGLQKVNPKVQTWSQGAGGVKGKPIADEVFGRTVATGDFNGDGFFDLAIGVPDDEFDQDDCGCRGGEVSVIYGSPTGLQATGAGGPDDQLWAQGADGLSGTKEHFDAFGAALAGGDFNRDGYADLVIGVPGEQPSKFVYAGGAQVVYGSPTGLQATGTGAPDDQLWIEGSDGVKGVPENNDEFGTAVAAGDFNGDGYADVGVGAPAELVTLDRTEGYVEVLYGSTDGIQATGVEAPDDEIWSQDSPDVEDVSEDGDYFGSVLESGDFNADGFSDLTVGVPAEFGVQDDMGLVNVLYGSRLGVQQYVPADQLWHQNSTSVKDEIEKGDRFGAELTVADFNGDGAEDVAISAPGESLGRDPGSIPGAGAANVLYGTVEQGLQAVNPDDQFFTQDSWSVKEVAEDHDQFGDGAPRR